MEQKVCACMGKNLEKFLQPIVLTILLEGNMTGYRIIKEIPRYATFRDAQPDPTGVYRYLRSMERRGLVANDVPDGADSCYSITDAGRQCLDQWRQTLQGYLSKLEELSQELG